VLEWKRAGEVLGKVAKNLMEGGFKKYSPQKHDENENMETINSK